LDKSADPVNIPPAAVVSLRSPMGGLWLFKAGEGVMNAHLAFERLDWVAILAVVLVTGLERKRLPRLARGLGKTKAGVNKCFSREARQRLSKQYSYERNVCHA
jgi:hypothetical protein